MFNGIIISDFDGTITKKDSLYHFFKEYASEEWTIVEELWSEGKISSKECLIKEFELVKDLSEELIYSYIDTIELDEYFREFYLFLKENNIGFFVVSDGLDYFIKRIFQKNKINDINIITNHAEFKNGNFVLSFPNDFKDCENDSGTCKCKVLNDIKMKYNKPIYYIGDGVSDYCVCKKADYLFAKERLAQYCKDEKINYIPFDNFKEIKNSVLSRA